MVSAAPPLSRPAHARRVLPRPPLPRPARSALLAGLGLAALVGLVGLPWLNPRMRWEDVADAPNHLLRIYVISHALSQGSLYPRWLPDLYLGYGYPLLNFYAPATYYLGAALHALGLSIYQSLQWTGMLALALGASGAFALARTLNAGSLAAGALAAVVYCCAPYPFITNLLVRAAIPEALALGLMPWLLLAAYRVVTVPRGHSTVRPAAVRPARGPTAATTATTTMAFAVALLMLTHNVSALIGLPIVATFAAVVVLDRARSWSAFGPSFLYLALGLALAAFFWLPALLESRYVQLDLLRGGIYHYGTWLFDPLRSGPAQAAAIFDYSALGRAAPERVSPWQLALWGIAVALCLAARRRPAARLGLFFAALALLCWLFATTWSVPLWERLPLVGFVQFPWRFYGPLALALALAAACALPPAGRLRLPAFILLVLAAGGLATGALVGRPILLNPAPPAHDVDARDLAAKEYNRYGMGTTSGGEFLPRTVDWPVEGATRRGIRIYEDAYPQASWQAGHVRVLRGQATVTQIHRDLAGIGADVQAETPTQLGFHQLAFPGWRAYVDGTPAAIGIARYDPYDASLGFMVLDLPAGSHRVEVRFGPTRLRHAANALSAASLAALVLLSLLPIRARAAPIALGVSVAAALGAVALGELHARPGATVRSSNAAIVADVVSALVTGRAEARTPLGAGVRLFPPYLERQFKWIRGDERRWLYMHPPSEVSLRLRVPPHAYFQAGLALDPPTWHEPVGDGVRFIVEADTGSTRRTLLDRQLHPRGRLEEQGWNDVWVPLAAYANQDITLRLRTEHGADPNFDWSGWSNPQVVTYHTSRPHPGTEHKW